MSKPSLKVTKDFTDKFNDIVKRFKNDGVLVGIPEVKTERKDESVSEPIGNAAILAINVFGSPINNIPPRDVMTIGIRRAKDAIADQFKKAAVASLSAGFSALDTYYGRAGFIASTEIKKTINDQDGIDGPSEATLRARRSMGFKGEKALLVTGQMRNAITYVVKGGK
jgi:hypothetical protein